MALFLFLFCLDAPEAAVTVFALDEDDADVIADNACVGDEPNNEWSTGVERSIDLVIQCYGQRSER